MGRRPGRDERQEDFFGAPAEAERAAEHELQQGPQQGPKRGPKRAGAGAEPRRGRAGAEEERERDTLAVQVARLSAGELRELAAGLDDEALGGLLLAVVRQVRRRMGRDARPGVVRGRRPVLDRAVQELVAAFSEAEDEDWY